MRKGIWNLVAGVWLGAAACGGGGGAECALDADCPTGRYCAVGTCTYDCAVDGQCAQGYRCDPARGRCVEGCTRTHGGVEACDGLDNDCDGLSDEDFPRLGTACQNGGCPAGVWACAADGSGERCTGPLPAPDDPTCDGRDEDCDGATDEDAPAQPCPLQLGLCLGSSAACARGTYPACDYGPDFTADRDDTCDRLDSDCDGATDEDALRLEPEAGAQAGDGQDNNCNGLTDEPGGVMVPVPGRPGVWIDAYESTVFERADCAGARYGEASDDYPPGFPAEGEATVQLHACSLAGLVPSGHLSWYRALRACLAQGKRLCEAMEWNLGCSADLLVPYPYGDSPVVGFCNDPGTGPGHATPAGSYPACTSPSRTYDMSGNLSEWTDSLDPDPLHPNCSYLGGASYLCELCDYAEGCDACDPASSTHERNMAQALNCIPSDRYFESFPRATAFAYLGARCCLDGP